MSTLGTAATLGPGLKYSDGIAASRTLIAVQGNAVALQRRLPSGWELAPYAGSDARGSNLAGANMVVPFHEIYAVRDEALTDAMPQLSYVAFLSQARNKATGELAHFHWFLYTADPKRVPGKYDDGKLARITRSQTVTKNRRGETRISEVIDAVGDGGELHLSLTYLQGGVVLWLSADSPNFPVYSAKDPRVVRWYKEDQAINVVRSDPMNINRVSEISLKVKGELKDVFDGTERIVSVVIYPSYVRHVYVP